MFNSKKKIVVVILAMFAVMSAFCAPAMAVMSNIFRNKGDSIMKRFTRFTVFAVLAMFAVMSAFCAPAFCLDQITIDLPDVDVTVTKGSDGYTKFFFYR